ncbi:MAG: hypothetical protein IJY05_01065 [Clostridia bacterium]|nr:hypothetical protein [Clostridia bacterium]
MENFKKFRRKFHIEALLKGVALGVSVGLIATAATWIVQKRAAAEWNILLYLLLFAGASIAASALGYLILRPSDKRIAKRLDKRAGLQEKTQTMREFAQESGEMVLLQRQDTESRLAATPKSAFKPKRLWVYGVVGALACASIITAAIIPEKTVKPAAEPPELEYNENDREWDLIALENLIEEVKDSDMQPAAKTPVLAELESLLADLKLTDKDALMRELVVHTIKNIDNAVEDVNNYREFAESINKSLIPIAQSFSIGLVSGDPLEMSKYMTKIRTALEKSEYLSADVKNLSQGIRGTMVNSGVAATDELYQRIYAFTTALESFAASCDGWDDEKKLYELEMLFTDNNQAIGLSLEAQKINAEMRDYVIERLKTIFGITDAEVGSLNSDASAKLENIPPDEDDKENNEGDDGGMGTGDTLYGSNEQIYDPTYEKDGVLGNHVVYGDVLDKYSAIIAVNKGELSQELIDLIDAYLNELNKTNQ